MVLKALILSPVLMKALAVSSFTRIVANYSSPAPTGYQPLLMWICSSDPYATNVGNLHKDSLLQRPHDTHDISSIVLWEFNRAIIVLLALVSTCQWVVLIYSTLILAYSPNILISYSHAIDGSTVGGGWDPLAGRCIVSQQAGLAFAVQYMYSCVSHFSVPLLGISVLNISAMSAMLSDLLVLCLSATALCWYRTSALKYVLRKQGMVYFLIMLIANLVPAVSTE